MKLISMMILALCKVKNMRVLTFYGFYYISHKNLFMILVCLVSLDMRTPYPSDITREQFEHIRPILESARKRTCCQWRALPGAFPKWQTYYSYFAKWGETREGGSLLERALKNRSGRSGGKMAVERGHRS